MALTTRADLKVFCVFSPHFLTVPSSQDPDCDGTLECLGGNDDAGSAVECDVDADGYQ